MCTEVQQQAVSVCVNVCLCVCPKTEESFPLLLPVSGQSSVQKGLLLQNLIKSYSLRIFDRHWFYIVVCVEILIASEDDSARLHSTERSMKAV